MSSSGFIMDQICHQYLNVFRVNISVIFKKFCAELVCVMCVQEVCKRLLRNQTKDSFLTFCIMCHTKTMPPNFDN